MTVNRDAALTKAFVLAVVASGFWAIMLQSATLSAVELFVVINSLALLTVSILIAATVWFRIPDETWIAIAGGEN
ncbi:hypothetical protein ACFFQF_01050 [Haladaptatus pallidirubidus]|uniref:Uncharacterized protein n=1 Tax=Haladaptatus pallidirubidus TaxID=1008152 RepID=A0AAV3UBT4_9EURY|nr:hypothetical protein [Haladaptatus pallidirubidus]